MPNAHSNNNHSHNSQESHGGHSSRNSHSSPSNSSSSNHTSNPGHDNPFIRFRHHVDTNLHAGLSTLMAAGQRRGDSNSSSNDNNPSPALPPPTSSSTPTPPSNPTSTLTPNPNPTPTPISNPSSLTISNPTPTPTSNPPSLTMATPLSPADADADANAHLESRLALLTGGTPAEAALAWRLFLARSAYSPLRLEREQEQLVQEQEWLRYGGGGGGFSGGGGLGSRGCRPVPRGVSREVADGVGWLEAFEDLMRVSSGLGVADLETSSSRWGGWGWGSGLGLFGGGGFGFGPFQDRGMVGLGSGARGWDWDWGMREVAWLERMRARGLTEVMFPVYDPGMGYQSPRTLAEWAERRRVEESKEREAGRLWEELLGEGRRAAEREADAWADEARREMRKEVDAWRDAAHETGSSFFNGIGGAVKTLGKVLEDEVKSLRRLGGEEDRKSKDRGAVQKDDDAPQTENDLYSVIQSAFHESERSLSNFFKLISEGGHVQSLSEPKPVSPPKVNTTEAVEDGITKKTTTEEFVDQHGNTHSKTETTWTDENGHVIMKQVQSSMGRSEHWEKTSQGTPPKPEKTATAQPKEQQQQQQQQQQHRESGWFWK